MSDDDNKPKTLPVHIPAEMISLWDAMNEPWGVKDLNSTFVYANSAHADLINLPKRYNVEGRSDNELPSPTAAFAEQFIIQDQLTISEKKRHASLEIHPMGKDNSIKAYVFEKMPYFNHEGDIVGTIFHGAIATKITLTDRPASFLLTRPSELFSEKEWEIIFLLQSRLSQKVIAKTLHYSLSRVGKMIEVIYQKAQVGSVHQLIEYLKNMKWENYVPDLFIKYGHTPIDV